MRCPFCASIMVVISSSNIDAATNQLLTKFYCLNTGCSVYPLCFQAVPVPTAPRGTFSKTAYSFSINNFWVEGSIGEYVSIYKMNHNNTPLIKTIDASFNPFDYNREIEKLKEKINLYKTFS